MMEKISRRGLFGLIGAMLAARKLPKIIPTFKPIEITGIQGWLPKIYVSKFCPNDRVYILNDATHIVGPRNSLAAYASQYNVA